MLRQFLENEGYLKCSVVEINTDVSLVERALPSQTQSRENRVK